MPEIPPLLPLRPDSPPENLGHHAHAFPECHATFDLACRFLGLGVVPNGILVAIIADFERVVLGRALPGTHTGVGAGFQQRRIDRRQRKVMVTLHDHRIWRFRDHCATPYCLHVALPSRVTTLSNATSSPRGGIKLGQFSLLGTAASTNSQHKGSSPCPTPNNKMLSNYGRLPPRRCSDK